MLNQTFKLRLAVCDALNSENVRDKFWKLRDDAFIKATDPIRESILNVTDDEIVTYWREWESAILGKEPPTLRPIDNDPMQALINATF